MEPRVVQYEIAPEDEGKTIKEYLMKKIGFSSKQLSRFKYRKDGILLNGEKRYVNALLREGDLLQIRLTQGGEPALERSCGGSGNAGSGSAGEKSVAGDSSRGENTAGQAEAAADSSLLSGYLPARDGRLQKIWASPSAWLAEQHPLRILYEDQDILAADKPSGVVCHPSPGHYDDTLSNQVAEHLGCIGRELDVRVTGRLDRDTSGIVIFALNTETAAQLIKQRQAELMHKLYIARVRGYFAETAGPGEGLFPGDPSFGERSQTVFLESMSYRGDSSFREREDPSFGEREESSAAFSRTIDRPLRRESADSFRMIIAEDGKAARTHYRVLRQMTDGTSIVACRIEHGRTHQIRVHMASIGHPIVGDRLYGPEAQEEESVLSRDQARMRRREQTEGTAPAVCEEKRSAPLMLHAYRAVLRQPFTGEEIRLEAPLPAWAEAQMIQAQKQH